MTLERLLEVKEIPVRTWRISQGLPSGMHMWFDPSTEIVKLFRLPPLDSELAAELYVDDVLDGGGRPVYLDKVGSVSAVEDEDESCVFDEGSGAGLVRDQLRLPLGS